MSDVPPKRRRTADQRLLADNQLLPPLLPPLPYQRRDTARRLEADRAAKPEKLSRDHIFYRDRYRCGKYYSVLNHRWIYVDSPDFSCRCLRCLHGAITVNDKADKGPLKLARLNTAYDRRRARWESMGWYGF
jgi:hypothetical protein